MKDYDIVLYEKCAHCHLFVEDTGDDDFAHLHRGDEADELLDDSHAPRPSGMFATLDTWRAFGPPAMRARFAERDLVCVGCGLPLSLTDDGDWTTREGTACDAAVSYDSNGDPEIGHHLPRSVALSAND